MSSTSSEATSKATGKATSSAVGSDAPNFAPTAFAPKAFTAPILYWVIYYFQRAAHTNTQREWGRAHTLGGWFSRMILGGACYTTFMSFLCALAIAGRGEEDPENRRRRSGRRRKREPPAPNSVYLKGVPAECDDDAISSALAGTTRGLGTVVSVSHREGRDFAFAVFDSDAGMKAAVTAGSVSVGSSDATIEEHNSFFEGALFDRSITMAKYNAWVSGIVAFLTWVAPTDFVDSAVNLLGMALFVVLVRAGMPVNPLKVWGSLLKQLPGVCNTCLFVCRWLGGLLLVAVGWFLFGGASLTRYYACGECDADGRAACEMNCSRWKELTPMEVWLAPIELLVLASFALPLLKLLSNSRQGKEAAAAGAAAAAAAGAAAAAAGAAAAGAAAAGAAAAGAADAAAGAAAAAAAAGGAAAAAPDAAAGRFCCDCCVDARDCAAAVAGRCMSCCASCPSNFGARLCLCRCTSNSWVAANCQCLPACVQALLGSLFCLIDKLFGLIDKLFGLVVQLLASIASMLNNLGASTTYAVQEIAEALVIMAVLFMPMLSLIYRGIGQQGFSPTSLSTSAIALNFLTHCIVLRVHERQHKKNVTKNFEQVYSPWSRFPSPASLFPWRD
jgi:hypothetical protein